jgi:hypothetical protein
MKATQFVTYSVLLTKDLCTASPPCEAGSSSASQKNSLPFTESEVSEAPVV